MYSDYEVDCWYLGKSFDVEGPAWESEVVEFPAISDDEADRIVLGLPMMAA
ncbi:MAG: hypothetical protein SWK76_01700 [Actinomycetota bacterium]|nr:hypothetical protein [Actinomycetota bacterium]